MPNLVEILGSMAPGLSQGYMAGTKLLQDVQTHRDEIAIKKEHSNIERGKLRLQEMLLEKQLEVLKNNLSHRFEKTPRGLVDLQKLTAGQPDYLVPGTAEVKPDPMQMLDKLMERFGGGGGQPDPQAGMGIYRGLLTGVPEEGLTGPQQQTGQRMPGLGFEVGGVRVNIPAGAEPGKTPQPYTPEIAALRAVQAPTNPYYNESFSSWNPGEYPSPEHQQAATRFARVQVPAERAGGVLDEKAKRLDILQEIAAREALGKRDPRVIAADLAKVEAIQKITLEYAARMATEKTTGRIAGELKEVAPGLTGATAIESARTAGRPFGESAQTQIRLFENTVTALDTMRRDFSEQEILRYAGIWNRGENYIKQVADTDPKFMRFLVLNEHLRSTAFQYGGKQLTPFEAAVVFGFTPHGKEIFKEQYLAKMDLLEERTQFELGRVKELGRAPKGAYESPERGKGYQPPQSKATGGFDELPDASTMKGSVVRDTKTGARMRADGTKWVPVK